MCVCLTFFELGKITYLPKGSHICLLPFAYQTEIYVVLDMRCMSLLLVAFCLSDMGFSLVVYSVKFLHMLYELTMICQLRSI